MALSHVAHTGFYSRVIPEVFDFVAIYLPFLVLK